MSNPLPRTFRISREELDRLCAQSGKTLELLADDSGVPQRTLRRVRSGKPGLRHTIHRLAQALGVSFEQLIEPGQIPKPATINPIGFVARLSISGSVEGPTGADTLAGLLPAAIAHLERQGVRVAGSHAQLSVDRGGQEPDEDYFILHCFRGKKKYWIAVAIRKDYVDQARRIFRSGEIDVDNIPGGRIIGEQEGTPPPELAEYVASTEYMRGEKADSNGFDSTTGTIR